MGLESVEIVMGWEEALGIPIPDAIAGSLFTPRHAIDYVSGCVSATQDARCCLSMRIFHQLRKAIHEVTGAPLRSIAPSTRLKDLFPRGRRMADWRAVRAKVDLKGLRNPWALFAPKKVEDLVFHVLDETVASLKPHRSWTRTEVREVIRHVVRTQIGVRRFSDHDEFVKDLGVD